MKILAALSIAVAATGLAQAQPAPAGVDPVTGKTPNPSYVIQPHAETARALLCLLGNDPEAPCRDAFYGPARLAATRFMQWSLYDRNLKLGRLVSVEYDHTQLPNSFSTMYLNSRISDVYSVNFERQKTTLYLARPDPDGKIHNWLRRNGAPDDEKGEMIGLTHIR